MHSGFPKNLLEWGRWAGFREYTLEAPILLILISAAQDKPQ